MKRSFFLFLFLIITLLVITSSEAIDTLQWSQLPDFNYGLNITSFVLPTDDPTDPNYVPITPVVGDDWQGEKGRKVTKIEWWGGYAGYSGNTPPQGILSFGIEIFSDLPKNNISGYSKPKELLFAELHTGDYTEEYVGESNLTGESIFKYSVNLFTPFIEDNEVYWLTIVALEDPQITYFWGWITAEPSYNWNDSAVQFRINWFPLEWDWYELRYPQNHPYSDTPINMSFNIYSSIIPEIPSFFLFTLGAISSLISCNFFFNRDKI